MWWDIVVREKKSYRFCISSILYHRHSSSLCLVNAVRGCSDSQRERKEVSIELENYYKDIHLFVSPFTSNHF